MNEQNLIIYKVNSLYQILTELNLNYKFFLADNENSLKDMIKNLKNFLILSNKKYSTFNNQIILDYEPISISKLLEKININFLKLQFNTQSKIKINDYTINLNSRVMQINDIKLKLTEKEINTIIYLWRSDKPVSISDLQNHVWNYQSDIETHTVETHIYRLRKKILNIFKDKEFVVSKKNGYKIN